MFAVLNMLSRICTSLLCVTICVSMFDTKSHVAGLGHSPHSETSSIRKDGLTASPKHIALHGQLQPTVVDSKSKKKQLQFERSKSVKKGCVYGPVSGGVVHAVEHVYIHDGAANPCRNGGSPVKDSTCMLTCVCPPQYNGLTCEEIAFCYSNPCNNGGSCVEGHGTYTCICRKGFKGNTCDVLDSCHPNPCAHEAICVEKSNGYQCVCKPGFLGKYCKEPDLCYPNPCHNGGTCSQKGIQLKCDCNSRFSGQYCHVTRICYLNPCKNGGRCVEDPDTPCVCPSGYKGKYCQRAVCVPNPCFNGGKCEVIPALHGQQTSETYRCVCPRWYRGRHCQMPHPCDGSPCANGATCVDAYSRYSSSPVEPNYNGVQDISTLNYFCICRPGFTDKNCLTAICSQCHDNATCINHRCVCRPGFIGDGIISCSKIKDPCVPNPCHHNATCSIGPDYSYDCHCPKGHCGPHCQFPCDICHQQPCFNGGTCIDLGDHRKCVCPQDSTGPDCRVKLPNPCDMNPCKNGGTCHYQQASHSYWCQCLGKWSNTTLPNCETCDCPKGNLQEEYADREKFYPAKCNPLGECYCPGEQSYEKGKGCKELDKRGCAKKPCLNGGVCEELKQAPWFTCTCLKPWTGTYCHIKNVCLLQKPNQYCQNGGTCVFGNPPRCVCPPNFTGNTCEQLLKRPGGPCEAVNPCLRGGTCIARSQSSYDCICHVRYTGPHCEVDKCKDCDVNADCVRGRCKCREGYTGSGYVCAQEADECGPCHVHAACYNGVCECLPGYSCTK